MQRFQGTVHPLLPKNEVGLLMLVLSKVAFCGVLERDPV